MRIALISDQHFDYAHRWGEHLRIMKWIADDVRTRNVDAIALGGDLYERRPLPVEEAAAAEWLVALAETAEVVGVYGNHDVPQSLAVLNRLRAKHPIHFYDRPAVHAVGRAAIACLPWPSRSALLASIGRPVGHEEASQVARDALNAILLGLGVELDEFPGSERFFLGHCMVRGSRSSVGQPIAPGTDFEIGPEDLGLVRAHAYMLGHIHCGQSFDVGGAPCFFPGSPRRTAFGETEDKHYAIVTVEDGKGSVEFVKTPCTQMCLFEASWKGEPRTLAITSKAFPHASAVAGAEVRLRYAVASDEREAARGAAEALRRAILQHGAVNVKVEERVIATTAARAPEIAAASTLQEKVEALWKARGTTPPAARAARLLARVGELETECQS